MTEATIRSAKVRESLVMKVGVSHLLHGGKKRPILGGARSAWGAPVRLDGEVMLPVEALKMIFGEQISNTLPTVTVKDKASGNGYEVVSVKAVEELGLFVTDGGMGLIGVATEKNIFGEDADMSFRLSLMKEFIFDYATPAEIYEDCKAHTDGFRHPYLYVDGNTFSHMRDALAAEGDGELKGYLTTLLERIEKAYRETALPSGDEDWSRYVGILPEKIPVNRNENPDGYDFGGRLGVPSGNLPLFALGYQLTKDKKYLELSYDYCLALGKWTHWGPAHFLNCADATRPFATALDWLYNDYAELGYDVSVLEQILFDKGVEQGYLASLETECLYPNDRVLGGFVYHKKHNNWNAVCTSGMTVGALALLGNCKYSLPSASLLADGLYYLANYGLGQYAPDGSYIESPGYWCYGTNNLFSMIAALVSATGRDYGYMSTWGLDTTCDFAVNAESSDFKAWSYHDGGTGSLDTSWFGFVARFSGRGELAALRSEQISRGKNVSLWDAVYYNDDKPATCEAPLQYAMTGINSYVARSGWDKGAIFVGLHGDSNRAPHGQVDAGAFVYYNHDIIWFRDIGGDNYNTKSYWGNKNKYYRRSCEGNNTLCLTDLTYGQDPDGAALLARHGATDGEAFAVLNTAPAYGGAVTAAERGLRLTAARRICEVRDEVDFAGKQSGYWIAHYDITAVTSVQIVDGGRAAILKGTDPDGVERTVRGDIVSDDKELTFDILDCYTFILPETIRRGWSEEQGGMPENSREDLRRLVIHFENKERLRLSVVIRSLTDGEPMAEFKPLSLSDWK